MKAGLRSRMLCLPGIVLFLALGGLCAFFALIPRDQDDVARIQTASAELNAHAAVIQKKIDDVFILMKAFASHLRGSANIPPVIRRSVALAQMEQLYHDNADDLADLWVVWEPNAFDGRDEEFIDDKPAHDHTGRFIPVVSRAGVEAVVGYNIPGKDGWYVEPLRGRRDFASEPYTFTYGGNGPTATMLTLSTPIVREGASVGVVGVDLDLTKLTQTVRGMYVDGSKAVLLTGEGTFLVAPGNDSAGKNVTDMPQPMRDVFLKAARGQTAHGEMKDPVSGETVCLVYTPVTIGDTGKPWVLGAHIPAFRVFAEADTFLPRAGLAGGAAFLLVLLGLFYTAGALIRPLRTIVATVNEAAHGNLELTPEGLDRKDEIGNMARALRDLFATVREQQDKAAEERRRLSRELEQARQAEERTQAERQKAEAGRDALREAVGKVGEVAQRVGAAVEEVSALLSVSGRNAGTQADKLGETSRSLAEVRSAVEDVAAGAEESSRASAHAAEAAREGATVVRRSGESIETAHSGILELKDAMQALRLQTRAVDNIITVISDIADQTNLLALNAAIEAARAGESGRGFAVVADEVRKLAEKTVTATKEVTGTITAINRGIEKGLKGTDRAEADMTASTAHAEDSGNALDTFVGEVETIDGRITRISEAARKQLAVCERMEAAVAEISRMAEATSSSMDESAAAVLELVRESKTLQELLQRLPAA